MVGVRGGGFHNRRTVIGLAAVVASGFFLKAKGKLNLIFKIMDWTVIVSAVLRKLLVILSLFPVLAFSQVYVPGGLGMIIGGGTPIDSIGIDNDTVAIYQGSDTLNRVEFLGGIDIRGVYVDSVKLMGSTWTWYKGASQTNKFYMPYGLKSPYSTIDSLKVSGSDIPGLYVGGTYYSFSAYDTTHWHVNSTTGNDGNSGHHPDSAFLTLDHLDDQALEAGDYVYLHAGSVWRESLDILTSGAAGNLITYIKYGSGSNPKIYGSDVSATWTASGTANIWQSTATFSDPQDVVGTYYTEIFFVETDDSVSWGYYEDYSAGFTNLTEEYDWTYNASRVYVYSITDPDDSYNSIEIPQRTECINVANNDPQEYLEFNGLTLRFAVTEGFDAGYPAENGYSTVNFKNDTVGYIGWKGSGKAYGLSVWADSSTIENCFISDCGRRSISYNYYNPSATNRTVREVTIRNNIFKRGQHTTGLDLASSNDNGYDTLENFYYYNNIHDDSDLPMTGRDVTSNQMFVQAYGTGSFINNIYVYNNVFIQATARAALFEGMDSVYFWHNTGAGHNENLASDEDPWALFQFNGSADIDYRNNVSYGNIETAQPEDWGVGIGNSAPSATYHTRDYNLYFQEDPARDFYGDERESDYYDSADWVTYKSEQSPFDANSPIPQDPDFVTLYTNLVPDAGSPLIDAGTPIATVTTDILGNARDVSTPTIGAYEYQEGFMWYVLLLIGLFRRKNKWPRT